MNQILELGQLLKQIISITHQVLCYRAEIQRILQQTYWLSEALEAHGPVQQLLIQKESTRDL